MKEKKQKKVKKITKSQSKIYDFFYSYKSVSAVLSMLCIFLLIYHMYIVKNINLYTFGGAKDDYVILDGSIYTGYDINHFSAPSIIYTGKDIKIKEYKIGYYIDKTEISVIEGNEEVNLYSLIRSSEFSFTETHKHAYFLSKDNLKSIKKLHFLIEGTTNSDEKIYIDIPLDITKISK